MPLHRPARCGRRDFSALWANPLDRDQRVVALPSSRAAAGLLRPRGDQARACVDTGRHRQDGGRARPGRGGRHPDRHALSDPSRTRGIGRGGDRGRDRQPIYSLIAKPEIGSFADLKGRVVGLSLAVDTISISMRKLLALRGLGEADYSVKELVGTPVRFECLKRGECDAVPLGQPEDFVAISQGYRRLGLSTDAVAAFQFQVVAARRAWAQANKDAAVRFVRALGSAFRFIRDDANRDAVVKAMTALTGASDEIARATLALYFQPAKGVMPKQAEIDLKGLAQVIAFMGEGGAIKAPLPAPERFIDLQYLRAAGAQ